MENPSDLIGNRTFDLLGVALCVNQLCHLVPQFYLMINAIGGEMLCCTFMHHARTAELCCACHNLPQSSSQEIVFVLVF
jgi:hypothetical protein